MIILHAANFDRKCHYRSMYNCDYKFRNGMIRQGHSVYEFSIRDVARESNFFRSSKLGVIASNNHFLKVFATIQPDLILLGHADTITNATLQKARMLHPRVKIAHYNVDPLFCASNFQSITKRLDVIDTLYLTTGGKEIMQFNQKNVASFFIPNPVDGSLEKGRAFEHNDQEYDVIFCTVHSRKDNPREKFMLSLQNMLPEVRFVLYGMQERPAVFGANYITRIQQAKMGVNISKTCGSVGHSRDHNYLYSSDRIAHITGNGLLAFVDRSTGLDTLYAENEVVFFDNKDDLTQKIHYYSKQDALRCAIAAKGYAKAHHYFNTERIAQYIIDTTFKQRFEMSYLWAGM